ncbi:MAG: hypothetical protein GY865_13315 [candidate division Zixibacteria bacterium]|nr:hypothetical protein [candidate division Zixibacteria bacterium]
MKRRLYVQIISLIIMAVILGLWGCEKKMSAPIIYSSEYTPTIDDYFPLSAGKTSNIISTNSGYEPSIITREIFECGEGVTQNNQSIYPWIHKNLAYSSIVDTSYFYQTETALYFYETADSEPETILKEPLEVGQSWQRFQNLAASSSNSFSTLFDSLLAKFAQDSGIEEEDKFNPPDDNGFPAGKIYPTSGSSLMTIVAIENVEFENGQVFVDCIKLKNDNGDYTNYYWYAKNYGLVKYVIGSTIQSLAVSEIPDGLIIGEYNSGHIVF